MRNERDAGESLLFLLFEEVEVTPRGGVFFIHTARP
jgi:hypothetical protein